MKEQEQPDRPSGDKRDIPKPDEPGQTMKNDKLEGEKGKKRKQFQLPPRPQKNP